MSGSRASHPFELEIAAAWPVVDWRQVHVLLAVSGGPDSVALLRAIDSLKRRAGGRGRVIVGNLNHGLRGADADADQVWLATLCDRMGMPFEAGAADVAGLATEQGDGWEAAARAARYEFLCRTAERLGARWVATGHTRDDQVETIVHRLIRGTGLAGLTGMRMVRPLSPTASLVRPMLAVRRDEVLEYLSAMGQDFRSDSTNADPRFTRNRLRHQLLPMLRAEFNADFDDAVARLAEQAAESQAVIDRRSAELAANCVHIDWPTSVAGEQDGKCNEENPRSAEVVCIDCRQLDGEPALLIREVLRTAWRDANWPLQAMGFDQWQQLAPFAGAEGENRPQINLPGEVLVVREGEILLLRRILARTHAIDEAQR
ncbi:MAG TPA: tRNA lysidine(34) synthetase TilS [Lacipirellulaceae bacterium]